jgi:hypothetical protein
MTTTQHTTHTTIAHDPDRYPYAPTMTGTTLARPVPSRSTPGLTHDAPWRDIASGAWGCPRSCQARNKADHSHQRELLLLGDRLARIAGESGRDLTLVVLDLAQQLARAARLTDGLLALQAEWLAPRAATAGRDGYPLTVVWLASTLVRDDRAALAHAARVAARAVAA